MQRIPQTSTSIGIRTKLIVRFSLVSTMRVFDFTLGIVLVCAIAKVLSLDSGSSGHRLGKTDPLAKHSFRSVVHFLTGKINGLFHGVMKDRVGNHFKANSTHYSYSYREPRQKESINTIESYYANTRVPLIQQQFAYPMEAHTTSPSNKPVSVTELSYSTERLTSSTESTTAINSTSENNLTPVLPAENASLLTETVITSSGSGVNSCLPPYCTELIVDVSTETIVTDIEILPTIVSSDPSVPLTNITNRSEPNTDTKPEIMISATNESVSESSHDTKNFMEIFSTVDNTVVQEIPPETTFSTKNKTASSGDVENPCLSPYCTASTTDVTSEIIIITNDNQLNPVPSNESALTIYNKNITAIDDDFPCSYCTEAPSYPIAAPVINDSSNSFEVPSGTSITLGPPPTAAIPSDDGMVEPCQSSDCNLPSTSLLPMVGLSLLELAILISTAITVPIAVSVLTALKGGSSVSIPVPDFQIYGFPQTINNDLSIPVQGIDFQPDNCSNVLVSASQNQVDGLQLARRALENNTCQRLFQGCKDNPMEWTTLDPYTLEGCCTPRLCGRSRVFVGRHGLCHDIYDPNECSGGRRLFYTAFGDPICDCPLGQYPFPTANDNCVSLFKQGPCPLGNVVKFTSDRKLECTPADCPSDSGDGNQLVRFLEDGICYELGTTGPCRPETELLGYDVFQSKPVCVNISNPWSPYFPSLDEENSLDSIYNQIAAEYDYHQIVLEQNDLPLSKSPADKRQEQNTLGAFQVSTSLPAVLLNPCRPGAQRSLNYKCTNPILPERRSRHISQAVRAAYDCPSHKFLQATGQCSKEGKSAHCGPSHKFNKQTGQCRTVF